MKLVIIFEEKNLRVIIPFHLCIFSEFISRASIGKREIKDFFFAFPGIKRVRSFHRNINLDYSFSEKALRFPLSLSIPQDGKFCRLIRIFEYPRCFFIYHDRETFWKKNLQDKNKKRRRNYYHINNIIFHSNQKRLHKIIPFLEIFLLIIHPFK